MSDSPAKFGFGFWALAVSAIVLLYPASFGPACWISQRAEIDAAVVSAVYQPVLQVACRGPNGVGTRVMSYANWGLEPGYFSFLSQDDNTGYCRWDSTRGFGCIF